MKQLFLTLMLTCIYIGAKAQQSLSYAYDAAGNRISRTIILETRASMAMEERKDSVFFEEMLAEKQLKIYPNPVEQQLNIAVDEYSSSLDGFFELYDTNGKLLKKAKMIEYKTQVDMSNFIPGVYILKISLNKKDTTWKIIKK